MSKHTSERMNKPLNKLLIVAPFVSLPGEPCFNRFLSLSYLWAQDYDVTLVTSTFFHMEKRQRGRNSQVLANLPFNLVLIDEPGYRSNVSFARFWSHRIFHKNFKRWLIKTLEQGTCFDLIYSAFPLISTNLTLGELKTQQSSQQPYKLVIDVQDIWPDSIFSAIPFLKTADFLISPLRAKACKAYSYADALVAVSKTYLDVALSHSPTTPSLVAYLGADYATIESIEPDARSPGKIKLFYLGTLSHSYDMETVIRGFSCLHFNDNVELHILGDGPDREKLEALAQTCVKTQTHKNTIADSANNIFFHGYLPYKEAIAFTKSCHIAINPIVSSATQSITNKLSDYIALGHPIISSQRNWEAMEIIKSQGGYLFKAGSKQSFAAAAQQAIQNCQKQSTQSLAFNSHTPIDKEATCGSLANGAVMPASKTKRRSQLDRLFDRRIAYPKITALLEKICADT